jgi:hypothetical protein
MKRFLTSVLLTGVFCVSTLAGEIPSVPGPPPPAAQSSANSAGEIPSGGMPYAEDTQSLTEAAVAALLTALGLASI